MKKTLLIALALISIAVFAQDENSELAPTKTKEGWKLGGVLPAISYDSDLGFQYGLLSNFYDYGDGTIYPKFDQSLYLEASTMTKGSSIFRLYYRTTKLIPKVNYAIDLSYLPDEAHNFYGFNGYETVYNDGWVTNESSDYKTRMFYKMQQKIFRFKNDFVGEISGNWKWIGGLNLQNFAVGSVDIDRFNKGKTENILPSIDSVSGLYERYVDWGLISAQDADGGFVGTVKAGLVYDSRDNIYCPSRGVWTEGGIIYAPSFMSESSFATMFFTHRQYFPVVNEKLIFAYRVGVQSKVGGEIPFYYKSQFIKSVLTGAGSEGLGGAGTIRGAVKNRIVGDGFVYGNAEFRWRPIGFTALGQKVTIGFNFFADVGRIVNLVEVEDNVKTMDTSSYLDYNESDYFNFEESEGMHYTVGAGARFAINEAFIVAVDFGYSPNKQDGKSGIYIGLNYLF